MHLSEGIQKLVFFYIWQPLLFLYFECDSVIHRKEESERLVIGASRQLNERNERRDENGRLVIGASRPAGEIKRGISLGLDCADMKHPMAQSNPRNEGFAM